MEVEGDSSVKMDDVLNWTSRMRVGESGSSERVGVIKSILYQMTSAELKLIPSILSHARGRMNKLEKKWQEEKLQLNPGMVAPAPAEIALPDPPPNPRSMPTPIELREMTKVAGWWKQFKPSDFLALDVEFVDVIKNESLDKQKAGIVAVWKNDTHYLHQQIKWKREEVSLTPYTVKLNGITYDSLILGVEFADVKSRIRNLFKNKIVLTVGGHKDFRSLDLDANEFLTFDLQSFYNRTDPNNSMNEQGMSLRDIFFYHFKQDCQRGKHSALEDAKCTYVCFFEGYTKSGEFWDKNGVKSVNFNGEVNLHSMERHKKLLYCATMQMFAKNCSCVACKTVPIPVPCNNVDLFE